MNGELISIHFRTYTYEIPENDAGYPERDPPKNTAMFYKTERNERSANYYHKESSPPVNSFAPLTIRESVPPQHSSHVHIQDVSTTTSSPPPVLPKHNQIPPGGVTHYPPQNTTIYKTETINTVNNQYRSPSTIYPNQDHYPSHGYPTNGHPDRPVGWSPHVNEPNVVIHKQTITNTRNVVQPRPEREPLLHPFPVDGPIITEVDGNPPKRVEDLMATFGDVRVVFSVEGAFDDNLRIYSTARFATRTSESTMFRPRSR